MPNWINIILYADDAIEEAIQVLNRESLQVVLVADKKKRLLGTVTDGDIRRAFIKHLGMDTRLELLMCKNPVVASDGDDRATLLTMMKQKEILQVPILDKNGVIVGLETLQHLLEPRKVDNPVFLMAGGFGKRLRPLTDNIPKPLLKVGGKSILEIILEQFVNQGFYKFYISTHYKAEMIQQHFGDGSKWGVDIHYVHETRPLGTAGALGLLPNDFPQYPMVMMNGDLFTKVNYKRLLDFHMEHGGVATMCVREYDFQVPFGVVQTEGHKVTDIVEKPVHKFFVNAGIYVLNPSVLETVKAEIYCDMPTLLEEEISKGSEVNTFPLHEYWMDIGRIEEYEKVNKELSGEFL